jgi:hypothetical protein
MSIDADSTTINFNGANLKIATSGKGLIFADGTTLSSNTEIGGGGGSSNLHQVMELGNATSNTILLENTGRTIVSSGNIESNIITTIIRFQEGSELPDGQGITLDNSANNSDNTFSNSISFTTGLVSEGDITVGSTSNTTILNAGGIEICKTSGNPLIDFKTTSTDDYDFRISQQSDQLVFTSATSARSLTFDGLYGSLGLHKSSPEGRLHIKQASDDSGGDLDYYGYAAINIERAASTSKWSIHHTSQQDLRFYYNRNSKALIRDNGTDDKYLNFTGQHRCFNEFSNVTDSVGMIVCSKSNKYMNFDMSQSPSINECLPVISLANTAYDKSCFGVISGKEESGNRTTSSGAITTFLEQESGDNRVFVNSLGEGAVWVSNLNGNLESGDYITTSNIAGYGQKQDSEFLANYTVAKITMDCDFNPQMVPKRVIKKDVDGDNVLDSNGSLILEDSTELITQYDVITLYDGTKVAFVGCTYHCG